MDTLTAWLDRHSETLTWVVSISLALFVASLVAIPLIAVYMRADYFVRTAERPAPRTFLGLIARVLKNLVGGVLLLMGLAMLVLPGQGVITMLIGISLLDFPGKRTLQIRIVRMKRVRRTINWMRARAGRPPLQLPPRPRCSRRASSS